MQWPTYTLDPACNGIKWTFYYTSDDSALTSPLLYRFSIYSSYFYINFNDPSDKVTLLATNPLDIYAVGTVTTPSGVLQHTTSQYPFLLNFNDDCPTTIISD